jgi:hypothetical protein
LVRKRKEGGLAPFLLIISQGRGSVWGSYCGASLGVLSTHWGFYLKKKVNGGDYSSSNSDYLRKRWHSPLICLVLRSGEVVLSSSLNATTVKARKIFQASQQSGIFFGRKPVLFDKIFRSVSTRWHLLFLTHWGYYAFCLSEVDRRYGLK